MLGRIALARNDVSAAEQSLRRAIQMNPSDSAARRAFGRLLAIRAAQQPG